MTLCSLQRTSLARILPAWQLTPRPGSIRLPPLSPRGRCLPSCLTWLPGSESTCDLGPGFDLGPSKAAVGCRHVMCLAQGRGQGYSHVDNGDWTTLKFCQALPWPLSTADRSSIFQKELENINLSNTEPEDRPFPSKQWQQVPRPPCSDQSLPGTGGEE